MNKQACSSYCDHQDALFLTILGLCLWSDTLSLDSPESVGKIKGYVLAC